MVLNTGNTDSLIDIVSGQTIRLADPTLDINKYVLDLESRKTSPRHGDIDNFFLLVENALISRQNYEERAEDKRLLFLEEDPPKTLDSMAITFEIASREPGNLSQGNAGTRGVKEVRPHYRGEREHPEHPGEKLVAMAKYYDNTIRFYIQAATNKEARRLMFWFEKLIDGFDWYFKYNGFRVIELGVGEPERIDLGEGRQITRYPMAYFVRSEDIFFVGAQELQDVIIRPHVSIT